MKNFIQRKLDRIKEPDSPVNFLMLRFNSIRTKLIFSFLAIGLISILVTNWFSYLNARDSIRQESFKHMATLRSARATHIESYFKQIKHELAVVSQNSLTVDAQKNFSAAFQTLNTAPAGIDEFSRHSVEQYYLKLLDSAHHGLIPSTAAGLLLHLRYIVKNPFPAGRKHEWDGPGGGGYFEMHRRYQPYFRRIMDEFGYSDLHLVDNANGVIVYSADKELDFAQSTRTDYIKDTLFARLIESLSDSTPGTVRFVDFYEYDPSTGKPVMFAGAPVFSG